MSPTDLLLSQLDQAYNRRSWHGTNLRGSVRSLAPEVAAWRPGPDRHSIQEIVVHCAYWKYAVVRRLTGEKRGSFALAGSNWFPRRGADTRQWREDLALLEAEHRKLRALVSGLTMRRLRETVAGNHTVAWLISGIVAHDLYHAGQIQALKALHRSQARGSRG